MNDAWWARGAADVLAEVGSRHTGLTDAEAAQRLGKNVPLHRRSRSVWAILAGQFLNPLVLLLLIAGLVSVAVGSFSDGVVILAIVLLSGGLGFYQENQAEDVIGKLLAMVRVTVNVRRDGKTVGVPVDRVVPGDVVLLSAGSMIPGDGRVLLAEGLQSDESPLTGESFPAEKQVDPTAADAPVTGRRSAVYLGTHVVSGTGEMVVVEVGEGTELGHLSSQLGKKRPQTDFDLGLQKFGYLLLQVTATLVLVIFAVNVLFHRPVLESFMFSVALAVGLTPELLPAIVTVNLARGARRMAELGVVIKRLPAIENLGAVTVMCSDKTGTLTEGRIRLDQALGVDGAPSPRTLELGALNATFQSGYANPLDAALRDAWAGDATPWKRAGEVAYDFTRKRLSVLLDRDGRRLLVTKGQLDPILALCTTAEMPDGTVVPIAEVLDRVQALHEDLASSGRRALGVAIREVAADAVASRELETGLCLVGLLAFADPPKVDAAAVIDELEGLGVKVKMITGDDRRVAAYVWRQLQGVDPVILTGADVQRLAGHALDGRLVDVDVFAEVEPQHKERIVASLRRIGHVVAYVGDGINDAAALHAADVGVSVEGASDAATEAADVVLRQRDLAVLANGVREGRRTMAKTLVYVRYTTSANFGNMFSMAVASLALPFLPLLPKQILLNNFLSDLPAIAITGDHVDPEEIARPGKWNTGEIRRFMFVFGAISSVFDIATFGVLWLLTDASEAGFQTGWFVESLLTELLVLFVLRTRRSMTASRPNRALFWLTVVVAIAAIGLPYTPVGGLFGLEPMPLVLLGAVIGITAAYLAATELAKRWFFRKTAPRA